MKYARIVDSIVQEVFTPPPGFALEECFTAELVAQFVPCGADVEGGWVAGADGELIPPSPPSEGAAPEANP